MTRVDTVVDKVTRKVRKRVKEHSTGNEDLKVSSNKKRKLTSKSGRVKKTIKRVKSNKGSDETNGKSSASNTQGSASNSRPISTKTNSKNKLKHRLNNNGAGALSLDTTEGKEVTGFGIKDGEAVRYTRVATGKELIPGLDGRTYIAQRLKEQYGGIVSDMGGEDQMSTIEKALSKQMASLITIGEDMIAQRCIDDPEYDYLEHLACVKTVNQVGRTLGTKRRMKIVKEQKLEDYIEGHISEE